MLQIISGRFFTGNEIEEMETDAILYSNISWIFPIATGVMELRPADGFRRAAVSSYVVRYINRMERDASALVLADSNDAVEQFRLLASFWFRAYFHPDHQKVELLCRRSPRTIADRTVPQRFINRFFDAELSTTAEETAGFSDFVQKAIAMPRRRYVLAMACLGAFFDALEVIGSNFDLAYSMLVYVLEALSRTSDESYAPLWSDYDETVKSRLDPVLNRLPLQDQNEIKQALLASAHLKLKKRFVSFVVGYAANEFFTAEAERVARALPRSDLETALKNLYDSRSGFVHQLSKVREQLRIPTPDLARQDFVRWEQQPYLTFSGLVRLTHHVLLAFILRQDVLGRETYPEWRGELPGIIRVNFAPQYWIARAESLAPQLAAKYFSGLLEHLVSVFPSEQWSCPDMSAVLAKIELLLSNCGEKYRTTLVWLYCLCCWRHPELDDRWQALLKGQAGFDRLCTIEGLSIWAISSEDGPPWDVQDCELVFEMYLGRRYRIGNAQVPRPVEIAIMAGIANVYLANGQFEEFGAWTSRAILDAAGIPALQSYFAACRQDRAVVSRQRVLGIEARPPI